MIYNIIISIPAGILAGYSAVSVFNKLPVKWLCDYNEEPCEKLLTANPRLKSRPWIAVFSVIFMFAAFLIAAHGWKYALLTLMALWLLLEISIADTKYTIIPDQFVVILAFLSVFYLPYHNSMLSPIYGALIGGGCMLFIGVTGKLVFKKEALGFGDVKLLAALGLITGPFGIALILITSSLLSCAVFVIGLLTKKLKRTDMVALGPYIALSAGLYLVI